MILCKWCGDENVIPLTGLFAERDREGNTHVYRFYTCKICRLEFKLEDEDATREYEDKTGR